MGHPALSGFEFDTGLFSKTSEGGPVNRKQLWLFQDSAQKYAKGYRKNITSV